MKKTSKKIMSLIVVMALVAGGSVNAFAAEALETSGVQQKQQIVQETVVIDEEQEVVDVIEIVELIEAIQNAVTLEELEIIESTDEVANEIKTDDSQDSVVEKPIVVKHKEKFAEMKARLLVLKFEILKLKATKLGLDVESMTFEEMKPVIETQTMGKIISVALKYGIDIEGLTKDEIKELVKTEKAKEKTEKAKEKAEKAAEKVQIKASKEAAKEIKQTARFEKQNAKVEKKTQKSDKAGKKN